MSNEVISNHIRSRKRTLELNEDEIKELQKLDSMEELDELDELEEPDELELELHKDNRIYFFKLNDFQNIDTLSESLKLLIIAIAYISYSCVNIHDNDKICLFIVKNDDGLIKAHNLSNEYISIIDIPVSNIVEDPIEFNNIEGSDKLFGMELNKTKLKDILTIINTKASLYHENDYYFHITCSKFKNNILCILKIEKYLY